MAADAEKRTTHVIQHAKEQVGEVIIADEVFAMIAGIAAMEVEGVHSMADNITRELIAKLGRNSLSKGVKVEVEENEVTVYLSLNIKFGYNIPEVSARVQDRVKSEIENMVGYYVKSVNIKIAGVMVEK